MYRSLVHLYQWRPRPPRTTPKRPRSTESPRPRGAARREALLEAVLRIVAEVGPDAVTHRRVAEVAGLPLASTTYWFDSKEHLLTAALELAAERDTARLLAYGAEMEQSRLDPLDAVVGAIGECDDGSQPNRGSLIATFALLLEAARRPALQQIAQRWTEAYLLTLSRLLERAGSASPRADAELLIGATDGLLLEQLASGKNENLNPRLRSAGARRRLVAERDELRSCACCAPAWRRSSTAVRTPRAATVVLVRVLLLFESAMYSAITPVLPHYAHVLGASKPAVGVLAGAYPAGIIPGSLIGAWIATRAGVRRTTLVGLLLFAVVDRRLRLRHEHRHPRRAALRPGRGLRLHLGRRADLGHHRRARASGGARCSARSSARPSSAP